MAGHSLPEAIVAIATAIMVEGRQKSKELFVEQVVLCVRTVHTSFDGL